MDHPIPQLSEFTPEQWKIVSAATVAYVMSHKNEGGVEVWVGICREWLESHERQQVAIRAKRPVFTPIVHARPEPDPLALVGCHACPKRDEPHRMNRCPSCGGTFCGECNGTHECNEFSHHL